MKVHGSMFQAMGRVLADVQTGPCQIYIKLKNESAYHVQIFQQQNTLTMMKSKLWSKLTSKMLIILFVQLLKFIKKLSHLSFMQYFVCTRVYIMIKAT